MIDVMFPSQIGRKACDGEAGAIVVGEKRTRSDEEVVGRIRRMEGLLSPLSGSTSKLFLLSRQNAGSNALPDEQSITAGERAGWSDLSGMRVGRCLDVFCFLKGRC